MATPKKITLAEAKANAAKAKEEPTTQPTPESGPSIDPPKEHLEQETQDLLEKYGKEDEQDPDEKAAAEMKAKINTEKSKTPQEKRKELPSVKGRVRTSEGKKGKERPCKRCKKSHKFGDPRSKYCPLCAKIVAAEAAMEGGWRTELVQKEVEEKLRPFLRIWLNLREACLEAEVGYSTVKEKEKTWTGFSDFIERHSNYPLIKAKRNIFEINSGGKDNIFGPKEIARTSRWLLERRRPEEYGAKVQIGGAIVTGEIDPKKQALMDALLAATLWLPTNTLNDSSADE